MNLYNYELNLNESNVKPRGGHVHVSPPYKRKKAFHLKKGKERKEKKEGRKKMKEKKEGRKKRKERRKEKIVEAERGCDSGKKE